MLSHHYWNVPRSLLECIQLLAMDFVIYLATSGNGWRIILTDCLEEKPITFTTIFQRPATMGSITWFWWEHANFHVMTKLFFCWTYVIGERRRVAGVKTSNLLVEKPYFELTITWHASWNSYVQAGTPVQCFSVNPSRFLNHWPYLINMKNTLIHHEGPYTSRPQTRQMAGAKPSEGAPKFRFMSCKTAIWTFTIPKYFKIFALHQLKKIMIKLHVDNGHERPVDQRTPSRIG